MLAARDSVPHFRVNTWEGQPFSYETIWQRSNLVLVVLTNRDDPYAAALGARSADFRRHETECVVTLDEVPGLHAPGALVADRWGEIAYVKAAFRSADLPRVEELLEWVAYLRNRCPECEGEAR
jgi:hypothetical protein